MGNRMRADVALLESKKDDDLSQMRAEFQRLMGEQLSATNRSKDDLENQIYKRDELIPSLKRSLENNKLYQDLTNLQAAYGREISALQASNDAVKKYYCEKLQSKDSEISQLR